MAYSKVMARISIKSTHIQNIKLRTYLISSDINEIKTCAHFAFVKGSSQYTFLETSHKIDVLNQMILTARSFWEASYFEAEYPPNAGAPYVEERAPSLKDGAKMAEVWAGEPYVCDGALPPNLDLLPPERRELKPDLEPVTRRGAPYVLEGAEGAPYVIDGAEEEA